MKITSKILFFLLLVSFTTELTFSAFASDNSHYYLMTESEKEEKEEEEKKENEENKDKITFDGSVIFFTGLSANLFSANHFFTASLFKPLPEVPPDEV